MAQRPRADAAASRRRERADVGRRGPVGHDPVEARGGEPARQHRSRPSPVTVAARVRSAERSSWKSCGSGDSHAQASPVDRMDEREPRGVQRLAGERNRPLPAVGGIADERMTERGEMHADLVRAAGLEPAAEQRRDAESLEHREVRARRLSRGDDGHRRAARRMPADRRVDGVAARRCRLPPARDIRGSRSAPAAGARAPSARSVSSRRPGGRSCPCRAGGRCRRAARRQAAAHDAAAHSAACRPSCRCPGARRAPPACRRRAARRPRRRSTARSLRAETPFPADRIPRGRRPARRRAPCASAPRRGRRRVTRPASIQARSRARENCGSARASAASKRCPAASAGSVSACVAASPAGAAAARRGGRVDGPGRHADGKAGKGVGYNHRLVRSD